MKSIYTILMFCSVAINSIAQLYNDPNFAIPASGYGSDGTHTVGVVTFPNPNFITEDIKIYHPSDITTQVPTLFYSHAYGGNFSFSVAGLLNL